MKTEKKHGVGFKPRSRQKITMRQVVEAAHNAGAKVSISLEPKEKIKLDNLRRYATTMQAIYLLAETRSIIGIECAHRLLREVEGLYNDTMLTLRYVREEVIARPISQPNYYPLP